MSFKPLTRRLTRANFFPGRALANELKFDFLRLSLSFARVLLLFANCFLSNFTMTGYFSAILRISEEKTARPDIFNNYDNFKIPPV